MGANVKERHLISIKVFTGKEVGKKGEGGRNFKSWREVISMENVAPSRSENCDECSVKYLHAEDNPSSLASPSKHSPADVVAAAAAAATSDTFQSKALENPTYFTPPQPSYLVRRSRSTLHFLVHLVDALFLLLRHGYPISTRFASRNVDYDKPYRSKGELKKGGYFPSIILDSYSCKYIHDDRSIDFACELIRCVLIYGGGGEGRMYYSIHEEILVYFMRINNLI